MRTLLFAPGWFVTLADIGYSRMFFLAFTRVCEECDGDPLLCQLDSFFHNCSLPPGPFALVLALKGGGCLFPVLGRFTVGWCLGKEGGGRV